MRARAITGYEQSPEYGRYIYAFCNIRTNQVLYSLNQRLKQQALKQLPDLGANNRPPTIRPDLWRPLWTLAYPENSSGYHRGLETFKQLREWRYVHEYVDTKDLTKVSPFYKFKSNEDIQKALDARGNTKIETVGAVKRRQNRRIKVLNIMNQRANSVADLAAVLKEHERPAGTKARQLQQNRVEAVRRMIRLDATFEERQKELEQKKATLIKQREEFPKMKPRLTAKALAQVESHAQALNAVRDLLDKAALESEKQRTQLIATPQYTPEENYWIWQDWHREKFDSKTDAEAYREKQLEGLKKKDQKARDILSKKLEHVVKESQVMEPDLNQFVSMAALQEMRQGDFTKLNEQTPKIEKFMQPLPPQHKASLRELNPDLAGYWTGVATHPLDDVQIAWQDLYDAEYAVWPTKVKHTAMGVVHTPKAPKFGTPAVITALDRTFARLGSGAKKRWQELMPQAAQDDKADLQLAEA